jgi:hypothetical protein
VPEPPPWRSDDNPWDHFVPTHEKAQWRLEDSDLWKPRIQGFVDPSVPGAKKFIWSPSGTYYDDSAEHLVKCLEADWRMALEKGMEKLVERTDTSVGKATVLDDVKQVFADRLGWIYSVFDYYAHMTSTDDIFHMHLNAYKVRLHARTRASRRACYLSPAVCSTPFSAV